MKGTLRLKDMRFYAYHGLHKHESRTGTLFIVNLSLSLSTSPTLEKGRLSDESVDYEKVYDWLKEKFCRPKYPLLEQVTLRLAQELMARFSNIDSLTLCVEKKVRKSASENFSASFELHTSRSTTE